MAEQKLTDRQSLSTSSDSSLIHVVEGGVSYKQTKDDFLKEDRERLDTLEASDASQGTDIDSLESRVDNLEENQYSGVVVYETLASLPATGTVNVSYKVSNDSTSSNNGYYHWNGSAYVKDASLANGLVASGNVDAVSGDTVYNGIMDSKDGFIILDKTSEFIITGYINPTGTKITDANWLMTDYLAITKNDIVSVYNLIGHPTEVLGVAFYDASKIFISGVVTGSSAYTGEFTTPTNAKYFIVSGDAPIGTQKIFLKKDVYTDLYLDLENFGELSNLIETSKDGYAVFDKSSEVNIAGYVTPTGTVESSGDFYYSAFLPIKENDSITYSIKGHINVSSISFYNYAQVFISNVKGTVSGVVINGTVTAPVNAAYYRLSWEVGSNHYVSSAKININMLSYLEGLYPLENEIKNINTSISALSYVDPENYKYTINNNPNASLISVLTPYQRCSRYEFQFIADKVIQGVTIPLVKNFKDGLDFTDGIEYKIFSNKGFSKSGTIPFADLAFYNSLTSTSDSILFDYPILFDTALFFEAGDALQINWKCVAVDDKIGLMYRFEAVDEPTTDFYASGGFLAVDNYSTTSFDALAGYSALTTRINYTYNIKTFLVGESLSTTKIERDILTPPKIYTVANDIDAELMKGQFSAGLYLDHLFKGITEELDIRFESTKSDRITFTPKASFIDTNVSNAVLNNGVNISEEDNLVFIDGNDIKRTSFNINHISTLNSPSKLKKPILMCIGDSVTLGQYANLYGNITDNSYRYSLLCEDYFKQDYILNGSVSGEYEFDTIGRTKLTRNMTFEGESYTIDNFIEGLAGISSSYFSTPGSALMDLSGNFSISWYLEQFRTMDDDGVRLYGSAGAQAYYDSGLTIIATGYTIGALVTNTTSYDVYKPTHILINLGLNGGNGDEADILDWYTNIKKMVDDYKADYLANGWDEPFIAVTIPDSAGTIFPSLHPNISDSCIEWDDLCDSRRDRINSYLKYWMENEPSTSEDTNKTYLLPFFWVAPAGDSVSFRPAPLPSYHVEWQASKDWKQYGFAWGQATHVNAIGHYNYAYQLYSWIKYTLAKF